MTSRITDEYLMLYGTCYNLQEKTTYPMYEKDDWSSKQSYSGMRSDKLLLRVFNTELNLSLFVIKNSPDSRRFGGFPLRVMRDLQNASRFGTDKILARLRSDRRNDPYYTLMSTRGHVIEMESTLRETLAEVNP